MTVLHSLTIAELDGLDYAIIGSGGFSRRLLALVRAAGVRPPRLVVATQTTQDTEVDGVPQCPLDAPEVAALQHLVLGSDVHQPQLLAAACGRVAAGCRFYDLSDAVQCDLFDLAPWPAGETGSAPFVLLLAVGHSAPLRRWLHGFAGWLARLGVTLVCRHPQAAISDEQLKAACSVIAWNGVTDHFIAIRQRLQQLAIALTYAECGFFPQHRHFYFDRSGVNHGSQLMTDPLDWVGPAELSALAARRQQLFSGLEVSDGGYCLVPLQIASDSNVQRYSSFTGGMQQYIDFVEAQPIDLPLRFKPHPKDLYARSYRCQRGQLVEGDTLSLLAAASMVRGINSSVLLEAALLGKPVVADGQGWLYHPCGDQQRLLAAMIARQFSVDERNFDSSRLARFSHISSCLHQRGLL